MDIEWRAHLYLRVAVGQVEPRNRENQFIEGSITMGLKTPEQYKSSLRDGRTVFYRGEKVPDVTAHPVIGLAVNHASLDYHMAEDPKYRELAVVNEGGSEYSR